MSRRSCFFAETDDDHADEPTWESMIKPRPGTCWLNSKSKIAWQTSRWRTEVVAPWHAEHFAIVFGFLLSCNWQLGRILQLCWELLSIARNGWSLDVIWTLAKEQFTNKLLRCTYPCLFVRIFRPVTFVFLARNPDPRLFPETAVEKFPTDVIPLAEACIFYESKCPLAAPTVHQQSHI